MTVLPLCHLLLGLRSRRLWGAGAGRSSTTCPASPHWYHPSDWFAARRASRLERCGGLAGGLPPSPPHSHSFIHPFSAACLTRCSGPGENMTCSRLLGLTQGHSQRAWSVKASVLPQPPQLQTPDEGLKLNTGQPCLFHFYFTFLHNLFKYKVLPHPFFLSPRSLKREKKTDPRQLLGTRT